MKPANLDNPAPGIAPDAVTMQNNFMSTYNVFSAATLFGLKRVVWASSETVFGLPLTRRLPSSVPITEDEAMRILHQVKEGVERPKPMVTFEIGEQVRVADGPFASFSGHVEEVDEQRARLKVAVSIFGRPTPVELEFGQVEKVA